MSYKALARTIIIVSAILTGGNIAAQQPNKPDAKTQVDALPGNFEIHLPGAYPQGMKVNYVRVKEAMRAFADEASFNQAASATDGYKDVKETTQYYDGLGRPLQTVARQITPGSEPKDMVTPIEYDALGREAYKFLPYISVSSDGKMKMDPFNEQQTFLQAQYPGEQVYYGVARFEASPLSRPLKTFAPGNSWAGSEGSTAEKAVQQLYLINTTNDVRIWNITNYALTYSSVDDTRNIPYSNVYYDAGQLYKNVTLDEAGNAVVEYKDKNGLVLLKKVQSGEISSDYSGESGFLCTYYVYDDFNQLRFVIPPKAVEQYQTGLSVQPDVTNELCFRYEYDERGRMIAKKVPGAGWVYMVYDKRDRLVYSQDANMRTNHKWLAYLYDELNRQVLMGMVTYSGSPEGLRSSANMISGNGLSSTVQVHDPLPVDLYVNSRQTADQLYKASSSITFTGEFLSEPTAEFTTQISSGSAGSYQSVQVFENIIAEDMELTPLVLTFYDNYTWTNGNQFNASSYLEPGNSSSAEPITNLQQSRVQTRGMVTGTKVRVIENPGDLSVGQWLSSVNFYDHKGRVVQVQADNYKGGRDVTSNLYDFTGKLLSSNLSHYNPAASNGIDITTNMRYDHAGRLLDVRKQHNSGGGFILYPEGGIIVAKNDYNELGQLKTKQLGLYDLGGSYSNAIESLEYTYNIRGWLKGVNKDYANGVSNSNHWFGMELNYDWGFDKSLFNGNIAGTKWRSKGDNERRSYGFSYDKLNRLMGADFAQHDGSGYIDNSIVNFDMVMGNGTNPSLAYDANGNILAMKQWGLKLAASDVIDNLSYRYELNGSTNTNKLKNVIDAKNDEQTILGDFRSSQLYMTAIGTPKTNAAEDYKYDDNGNLTKDLNKDIGTATTDGIEYNHLNLPWKITFQNSGGTKGTITYIYDAVGNKLEKRVHDYTNTTSPDNVTTYIGGMVYENNQPQFLAMEEGRIRIKNEIVVIGYHPCDPYPGAPLDYCDYDHNIYGSQQSLFYDYFIKDHLGNVRMVLTSEGRNDVYQAGMEPANRTFEQALFGDKVNTTEHPKPTGFDTDPNNVKVSMLNDGITDRRVGPGVILKVMAGDKIKARTFAWYLPGGDFSTNNDPLHDIVINLLGQLVPGVAGAGKGTAAKDVTDNLLRSGMEHLIGQQPSASGAPKAYLNWILLDEEQFKEVTGNFGSVQVPVITDAAAPKQLVQANSGNEIEMLKNGYLYVYVSNESKANVYFDDIRIEHIRGALLEETHYYPWGLTMAGISSKAANTLINKEKFTSQELDDELGLNWYQLKFRSMDPQLGRFLQVDPLASNYVHNSTYAYAENDVIRAIDVEGLEKFIITAYPELPRTSVISYDPTPIKNLGGTYQVHDTRTGKIYTDAFPEQAMQKNLGGSQIDKQGNLHIRGDNDKNLEGGIWDLHDFTNPITGDNNPRDGFNKGFSILGEESAATPMKQETRTITDQVIKLSADQTADGTFEKSNGTITHNFDVPASTTPPSISIFAYDGGTFHNNFNILSGGTTLATIRETGSANVTAPANSTLAVQVTGIPKNRSDIYSINVSITTTRTQQVTTIDRSKLKPL